jgi:GNAT superfamily N-acetyltransferase
MSDWPTFIVESDLAPGDRTPHPELPAAIELIEINSAADPHFSIACELLEAEFLEAGEMESRESIAGRFKLDPAKAIDGFAMKYTLLLLRVQGELAGVRDHSTIISEGEATVHLSHALVLPKWRRKGLSAILRTLPITHARRASAQAGFPDANITLFCEMECYEPEEAAHQIRRRSYEKAGFLTIAPTHGYIQPCFAAPSRTAQNTGELKPLPLDLLFHRVGRNQVDALSGQELLQHIERVYALYQTTLHAEAMTPCQKWLEAFRDTCADNYQLHPPTKIL